VHVFWIQGPRRQARLKLQGSFFVIGRTEPFAIFQDDPSISREHAVVVATDEGILVKDLGSSNGVFLNGERLGRYAEVPLSEADELLIGRTSLRLLTEEEQAEGEHVVVDRDGRSGPVATRADVEALSPDTPRDAVEPPAAEGAEAGDALDDPEDVPGEETEQLERPDVLPVDSDDEEDSDDEGLRDAPTEDEEPESLAPAPTSEVSDEQLAEELTELADLAEREPELE
jgi:pSer/pThr/pTyr-binding forkhead associated (FHA) protein